MFRIVNRFWLCPGRLVPQRPFYNEISKTARCNRTLHSTTPLQGTEGEARLTRLLKDKLEPTFVEVIDISGGCGSMYQVTVTSKMFKGLRTLQQHRMVNEALGDEVKALHGLTLKTAHPES